MRLNWKETPRTPASTSHWLRLYVTLNPKGEIRMSRTTYERLGEPKAVLVLFDDLNNRIGLKPAALSTRNAFYVGRAGAHGGRRVFALAVINEWNLDIPQTIRFYDARVDEEGILVLDLRTARVPDQVRNHPRNKRASHGSPPA